MKSDGRKNVFADETICINLARRTILMYRLSQPDSPVELKFQAKYGNIVSFRWFADGFLLVAFSEGFVVAVNTSVDQLGEELHVRCTFLYQQFVNFNNSLCFFPVFPCARVRHARFDVLRQWHSVCFVRR
jgi:hypothetical protein